MSGIASKPNSKPEMAEQTAKAVAEEQAAIAAADSARRQKVNLAFRLGGLVKSVHRLVDTDARDLYDDDHHGENDSDGEDFDSDQDSDSDRVDDDEQHHASYGSEADGEIEPIQEHDEPVDEPSSSLQDSHQQMSTGQDSMSLKNAWTSNATKDPTSGSYHFAPEPIMPGNATKKPPSQNQGCKPASPTLAASSSASSGGIAPDQSVKQGSNKHHQTDSQGPTAATQPTSHAENATSSTSTAVASKKSSVKTPLSSKPDPLAPTAAAPFGYKLVKVRKPNGDIVQVKRPLKAEDVPRSEPPVGDSPAVTPANLTSIHAQVTKSTAISQPLAKALPTGMQVEEHSIDSIAARNISAVDSEKATAVAASSSPIMANTKAKTPITVSEKEIEIDEKQTPPAPAIPPMSNSTRRIVRASRIMQITSLTIMIILPLLFLGLGIATAAFRNRRTLSYDATSTGKDPLIQTRDVAISLWPIVYAAIIAQVLKGVAAYRLERGIPLVTLEQLVSSHSVGGAIKQPFLLRTFNWTSVLLLIIWGLSPLAGQGLVRMLSIQSQLVYPSANVMYVPPQSLIGLVSQGGLPFDSFTAVDLVGYTEINAMYSSLLLDSSYRRTSSQDPWGNLKIPFYDLQTANASDGLSVANNQSSLLGIPFYFPPDDGTIEDLSQTPALGSDDSNTSTYTDTSGWSFTMQTTYFGFNCNAPKILDMTSSASESYNFSVSPWGTFFLSATNNSFGTDEDNVPYSYPGNNGTINMAIALDVTDNRTVLSAAQTSCQYQQVQVNNSVICYGRSATSNCAVYNQSIMDLDPDNHVPLGYWIVPLMLNVAGPATKANADLYSLTEQYIFNPDFASQPPKNVTDYTPLLNLTGVTMSLRFGQLVNSLWLASSTKEIFTGTNLSALYDDFYPNNNLARETIVWRLHTEPADPVNQTEPQYHVSWAWWVVLMACSGILLFTALLAAYLEKKTIGPDFLGFANTAIRKGIKLPKDMNALSARDRLAALHECEVLLQDVRPNDEMGKVALGVKEEKSVRLVSGRLYR